VDISMAWENVRENIKISAKEVPRPFWVKAA
jgi:hypothetical protein